MEGLCDVGEGFGKRGWVCVESCGNEELSGLFKVHLVVLL